MGFVAASSRYLTSCAAGTDRRSIRHAVLGTFRSSRSFARSPCLAGLLATRASHAPLWRALRDYVQLEFPVPSPAAEQPLFKSHDHYMPGTGVCSGNNGYLGFKRMARSLISSKLNPCRRVRASRRICRVRAELNFEQLLREVRCFSCHFPWPRSRSSGADAHRPNVWDQIYRSPAIARSQINI